MVKGKILIVLSYLWFLTLEVVHTIRLDFEPSIIGGQDANIQQVPFFVFLFVNYKTMDKRICGGSYITPLWVLTAAHCLDNDKTGKKAKLAMNDAIYLRMELAKLADIFKNTQKAFSVRLIMHEGYVKNRPAQYHDLGLVQIDRPFKITNKAIFATLPDTFIDYDDVEVIVVGFGASRPNDTPADHTIPRKLQMLQTTIRPKRLCDEYRVTSDSICVGRKGKTACFGDSGGPMVYNNILIGVLSSGITRDWCNDMDYVVYTNVYSHISWIINYAGKLNGLSMRNMVTRNSNCLYILIVLQLLIYNASVVYKT